MWDMYECKLSWRCIHYLFRFVKCSHYNGVQIQWLLVRIHCTECMWYSRANGQKMMRSQKQASPGPPSSRSIPRIHRSRRASPHSRSAGARTRVRPRRARRTRARTATGRRRRSDATRSSRTTRTSWWSTRRSTALAWRSACVSRTCLSTTSRRSFRSRTTLRKSWTLQKTQIQRRYPLIGTL